MKFGGLIVLVQGSSAFSFRDCLPRGYELLLVSGVATFILERLYLNRDNFWATFSAHFFFGFACFSVTAFVMWVSILLWLFYLQNSRSQSWILLFSTIGPHHLVVFEVWTINSSLMCLLKYNIFLHQLPEGEVFL